MPAEEPFRVPPRIIDVRGWYATLASGGDPDQIPLLLDAFFIAMAVTIIFGLLFATVLTMVLVPVLYAVFYRVPSPARAPAPSTGEGSS